MVETTGFVPCLIGHERCAVDGCECECEQHERDAWQDEIDMMADEWCLVMTGTPEERAEQVVIAWTTDRFQDRMDDRDCEELQELITSAIRAERERCLAIVRAHWRKRPST